MKYVCIHGHFYQPPRENPWTGEIDAQESAAPFHDWNERINKECYAANVAAPILNAKGEAVERVNNFRHLSFDIGPTLLSWLRRKDPATYKAIVEADRQSVGQKGWGNAMAQSYNHMIMPLASQRDRETQVLWGIRDFEFHYGRRPQGMWLPETAVDRQTLALLADNGILFTVLAPHQARRVRHVGFGSRWHYTNHENVDPKNAYRVLLDRGRQFHVFFYDGPISRAIAFQGLLNSGDQLVHRMLSAFGRREREQLVSSATDGESFGHHHKFGEMAVAYAAKKIESQRLARITNYAAFLERVGSFWEADIHENSSWSCAHGVERWRSDCGCRMKHDAGWNQKWRSTLRDAFDFLKETVDAVFERELDFLTRDPWAARNDYVTVLTDGSLESRRRFLSRHGRKALSDEDQKKIWDLLEAEKFAMFMYTSCGWFFDDISGIEPVQTMRYALRAMELVQPYHSKDLEEPFVKILSAAKSNLPERGTGADVFRDFVKPSKPAAAGVR